jgi:hypothetical protein
MSQLNCANAWTSGRLLCRQAELDYFSPFVQRNPFCTPLEINRNVKLNYLCHGSVLPIVCFSGTKPHAASVIHGWPSHSQPHLQRVESLSLSFLRSALHNAHDLIHIVLLHSSYTMFDGMIVVPDAAAMSFDCQTNPFQFPDFMGRTRLLGAVESAFISFHISLCQSKPNRFVDSYQGMPCRAASWLPWTAALTLRNPNDSHRTSPPRSRLG